MKVVSIAAAVGAAALALGMVVMIPGAASASTSQAASVSYGTISNFDVFNDTGQVTNGFEIELDGVTSTDISYTFGAPYERYGNPTITPFSGGVNVIYASPWDPAAKKFTQATPMAPTPIQPTAGHQCWTGGSANYATAGCEHFGLGLTANPTNVVYHWLVADPVHAGQLMPLGGGVPVPAPQWSTSPPPPGPNPHPVINAVAPAPEPDLGQQLGDAVWVKVYMHQFTSASDLNHMLDGDSHVPNALVDVETDWLLIQAGVGGGLQTELANSDQLGPNNHSVVRKYQFFKYTGPYSSENHEATPINDSQPSPGERGSLIANQMAGLNLAAGGVVPGDRVRPKAYFAWKPPLTTTSHSATFHFRATDNVANTKFGYFCSLDRKIPSRCSNPKTYTALKRGVHSLSVYAIDKAANPSKAITYRWTIK